MYGCIDVPDAYQYIARERVILRVVVGQPPAPSTREPSLLFRSAEPPAGVPAISSSSLSVVAACSAKPRVAMSYVALAIPSPSTPAVIGSTSTSVGTRRTP